MPDKDAGVNKNKLVKSKFHGEKKSKYLIWDLVRLLMPIELRNNRLLISRYSLENNPKRIS